MKGSNKHPKNLTAKPKSDDETIDREKECRYCRQSIRSDAKVCQHCGNHQNKFCQHFRIEHVGLLASIIMVFIALSQLKEAREERVAADEALTRAREAAATAISAKTNTQAVYKNTKELALTLVKIVYCQTVTKREIGTERDKAATRKIQDELDKLLTTFFPDSNDLTAFVSDLEDDLPAKND